MANTSPKVPQNDSVIPVTRFFRYSVNKNLRRRPFFRYSSEFRYLGFRYSSRYLYFCDGRAEHVRIAGEAGALMTCLTCFADDCLEEDMTACPSGHLFCRDCLRRASEVAIGDAKVELKCLGKQLHLVYFHERIISPSKYSIHLPRTGFLNDFMESY